MLIRIDDIKDAGQTLNYESTVSEFPELSGLEQCGEVFFPAPIVAALRVFCVNDMIELEGTVSTSVRFACSRCLKDFSQALDIQFTLTYIRELPSVSDEESGEELELEAEDLGLILLTGDEIDLSEVIQEQILLGLPLQPLCDDSCRGLCPHCGGDRNVTLCGCAEDGFGGKFSVLKDWNKRRN